jgi:hypothetical protein
MNTELIAILDGWETGRVASDARGRLSFTYNEEWHAAEKRLYTPTAAVAEGSTPAPCSETATSGRPNEDCRPATHSVSPR